MTKKWGIIILSVITSVLLSACAKSNTALLNFSMFETSEYMTLVYQEKVYVPFCAVNSQSCGERIGFVDDDTKHYVYAYKDMSSDEWIVDMYDSGLMDSPMLWREINVTSIPEGLISEYEWNFGIGEDDVLETNIKSDSEETITKETEVAAPSREKVQEMREQVLTGMTEDEKKRLITNIKDLNCNWEGLYFENIFEKLSDADSLYWNYIDGKGDIVIGYVNNDDGTSSEIIAFNRFNYETFIELIKDMQVSIKDEQLNSQLNEMCEEMRLAHETHDVKHAENVFHMLHDMDYFLLRYGIDDVGPYVKDGSFISKYYASLVMYE